MPRVRIPEGDDWKDHAVPCPNCGKPVLREYEHYINGLIGVCSVAVLAVAVLTAI